MAALNKTKKRTFSSITTQQQPKGRKYKLEPPRKKSKVTTKTKSKKKIQHTVRIDDDLYNFLTYYKCVVSRRNLKPTSLSEVLKTLIGKDLMYNFMNTKHFIPVHINMDKLVDKTVAELQALCRIHKVEYESYHKTDLIQSVKNWYQGLEKNDGDIDMDEGLFNGKNNATNVQYLMDKNDNNMEKNNGDRYNHKNCNVEILKKKNSIQKGRNEGNLNTHSLSEKEDFIHCKNDTISINQDNSIQTSFASCNNNDIYSSLAPSPIYKQKMIKKSKQNDVNQMMYQATMDGNKLMWLIQNNPSIDTANQFTNPIQELDTIQTTITKKNGDFKPAKIDFDFSIGEKNQRNDWSLFEINNSIMINNHSQAGAMPSLTDLHEVQNVYNQSFY